MTKIYLIGHIAPKNSVILQEHRDDNKSCSMFSGFPKILQRRKLIIPDGAKQKFDNCYYCQKREKVKKKFLFSKTIVNETRTLMRNTPYKSI